jgi:hypothetical protein
MKRVPVLESSNDTDEAPQVLWFGNWRGVYLFVLVVFVLTVTLLAILSGVFA